MTLNARNPLEYFCPPNGCGPSVATEHDLERFLAFGFVTCHENLHGDGTESLAPEVNDVFWLRKNFLNTVQIAKDALEGDMEPGYYDGDHDQGGFTVALKQQPKGAHPDEPVGLHYEWVFLRYDSDDEGDTLLIELRWIEPDGRGDQTCLFLDAQTLRNEDAAAIIDKANDANNELRVNEGALLVETYDGPDPTHPREYIPASEAHKIDRSNVPAFHPKPKAE